MSEEGTSDCVQALLSELAQLTIEQEDLLHEAEQRYQQRFRTKEVQHREAIAALEREREIERDNDYEETEIRKQLIFKETQEKRRTLLAKIKRAEQGPSTCVATYPEHSAEAYLVEPNQEDNSEENQDRRSSPVALVDLIRETPDGEIETETIIPAIPPQRGVLPRWIPIGTRVWVLNTLKLKETVGRTHLQGTVSRHGTLYHFIKIWNPITKDTEEHRRHRDSIAIV